MFIAHIKELLLIIIFTIVVAASGADLLADLDHGASVEHIIKEAIVIGFSAIAIAFLLYGLYQQKLEINSLRLELEEINHPKTPPRKYVLEGRKQLAHIIAQQFSEWSLTGSEIEVGWLLLKGLTLNEISIIRNTQEKTVRQQASSIYQKAGINGRHAFSAWFIEDIL